MKSLGLAGSNPTPPKEGETLNEKTEVCFRSSLDTSLGEMTLLRDIGRRDRREDLCQHVCLSYKERELETRSGNGREGAYSFSTLVASAYGSAYDV